MMIMMRIMRMRESQLIGKRYQSVLLSIYAAASMSRSITTEPSQIKGKKRKGNKRKDQEITNSLIPSASFSKPAETCTGDSGGVNSSMSVADPDPSPLLQL